MPNHGWLLILLSRCINKSTLYYFRSHFVENNAETKEKVAKSNPKSYEQESENTSTTFNKVFGLQFLG